MPGSAISDRENHPGPSFTRIHSPLRSLANSALMTRLTIRVPDKLKEDLENLSRRENKTVSGIIRESLRRYAAVEKLRVFRKTILPFAEAQGLLSDEDVFKALS